MKSNGKMFPKIRKVHKPTGPWLTDGDLRHDELVKVGLPGLYQGEMKVVEITFTAKQIRSYMEEHGGFFVVHPGLIRDLQDLYFLHIEMEGRPPESLSHTDYPFMRFKVQINRTWRRVPPDPRMGEIPIPGPVRFLSFLAYRRIM